jgi:hypothetical protein
MNKRHFHGFLAIFFLSITLLAATRTGRFDRIQAGNVQASGNTITNTDTNQDLTIDANGTGILRLTSPVDVSDDGQGDVTHTIAGSTIDSTLEIHQTSGSGPGGLSIHRHISSANLGAHLLGLKSRGTHDTPTVVQDGDALSRFVSSGYDGTDYELSSEIRMSVDGTPADSANDMPGRIGFYTSADGSGSPTEAMRIDSSQSVNVFNDLVVDTNTLYVDSANNS